MFTCKKCGGGIEHLEVVTSGPHRKLICTKCNTFQKFLGSTEYDSFMIQKKAETPLLKDPATDNFSSLQTMQETARKIQFKVKDMLAVMVRKSHPNLNILPEDLDYPFFWECEKSPCGYCVYDSFNDPTWDNCIYCGKSYERK